MRRTENYIKYYDDKVKIDITPSILPYEGGNISVSYSFTEIIEFNNGYKTKNYLTRVKDIFIPSRVNDESKYMTQPLNGEFYDNELDKMIRWNGVIQEGIILPELIINMKDSYVVNDIPLIVKSTNNIIPSDLTWEDTMIKKTSKAAYNTTIENGILTFNKKFTGIILLTAKADDYITAKKLVSINYDKNAKLVYSISDIHQSSYELKYNEQSFELSFVGKQDIVLEDEVINSTIENITTTIYLPSENTSDSIIDIRSEYTWNGIKVPYVIKQHGAKECNGNIEYNIVTISPNTSDDYISWNETNVQLKYITNKREYCNDGSVRETITSEEQVIYVGLNDSSLDIVRSGVIQWETATKEWKCIQEANPHKVLLGSSSEIISINDNFDIPYSAGTIDLEYKGVTHKYYMNNRIEDEYITTSTTVSFGENTSSSVINVNGSIMWNKSIKNWSLNQLPNPKKIINTRYDIEIVYPHETDTIPWSAETLTVIYNTLTINTCLDGSVDTISNTTKAVKEIEKNTELSDILLNGTIVWNNSMSNWSCIQTPNQAIIFDKAEYFITNVKDGFTVPSTSTTATITYDIVSRIYFVDGHFKDEIINKTKQVSFTENLVNERREITGELKWNNDVYQWVIYQRGKRKQNNE